MSHENTPINTHIRYPSHGTDLIGLESESEIQELERNFSEDHAHEIKTADSAFRPQVRSRLVETMDDSLLAEFQSTFMIGGDVVTNTHGPHPHYTLYKQRGAGGTFGNQEERRKKFLEEQKARRKNYADYARRVVEGNLSDEEDDEMEEGAFDEVDEGTQAVSRAASGQEKPPAANGEVKQVGVFCIMKKLIWGASLMHSLVEAYI